MHPEAGPAGWSGPLRVWAREADRYIVGRDVSHGRPDPRRSSGIPEQGQGLVLRHERADQVPKGEIDGLTLGGELVTL